MARSSTTVRVASATRDAIARLSRQRGVSASELLEQLIQREEENELLAAMNGHFSLLNGDPVARRDTAEERRLWEETLLDGLVAR